jgi:hypothetical protein
MTRRAIWLFLAAVLSCPVGTALAATKTISDVPSYPWYRGCGPTAGGMIIGYWDANGFPNLITAGDGTNSWSTNQQGILTMIASVGHDTDYWPMPDRTPPPPVHADDCLADFMWANRDPWDQGGSYDFMQGVGLTGYANYCGYPNSTSSYSYFGGLWAILVGEINADRPMEFCVDSTGNGTPDHFVTVVGYDDTPGALQYRAYNTDGAGMYWYSFDVPAVGRPYGVESGTTFKPIPEPATMALLGLGALVVTLRRNRRAARGL